jgi:uncharacterized protein YbbC (DUF1343 family)
MLAMKIIFLIIVLSYSLVTLANPIPGSQNISKYYLNLQGKKIALVVNPSSEFQGLHLVDQLYPRFQVVKLFALEHGIRGNLDAGQDVGNGVDRATGLPIVSLYGKKKSPSKEDLSNVDVIVYDIQDVGVRFYTYISSLRFLMEAAAKYNKELIILDRPNPLGDLVDGPILDMKFKSFVGMYPIPVIYGLTPGELALMAKGEGWVPKFKLHIAPVSNYTHATNYQLPVKPSPNLVDTQAINLYPSLVFFEATQISVGRGTHFPFKVFGYPDKSLGDFTFTPKSIQGMSLKPKHMNQLCFGKDLRQLNERGFSLKYVLDAYNKFPAGKDFFISRNFFNKLMGNDIIIKLLPKNDLTLLEDSYQKELLRYKFLRRQYLIYP